MTCLIYRYIIMLPKRRDFQTAFLLGLYLALYAFPTYSTGAVGSAL
jgi:hypothetical protein